MMEMLNRHFKSKLSKQDIFGQKKLMFSDIIRMDKGGKEYEEIEDLAKLLKVLVNKMDDYNADNQNKLNLVFFDQCVEHILRISRVLR